MAEQLFYVLGGIGMFLMGMKVMTSALREAAGTQLQAVLTRFTTTPLTGVISGGLTTAAIQSSSATTVMTVGFVGAGLLTMSQALGVIYGANIGTTATGWLVSLLGFKLKLGTMAMALLFPASLLDLLGRGGWARAGRMLAGLCLLLIGLDLMQAGMKDVSDILHPEMLPSGSVLGLLALAVLGAGLTVVMQSSSAAMALALVMIQSGAISLTQAIAIVAGMNIGTTCTALLASLGGSLPMRQTAVANLLFNIATSLLVVPVMMFGLGALQDVADRTNAMTAILVFHTGFNLVGAMLFLPITAQFARFINWLLPEAPKDTLIDLDRALLSDPAMSLLTVQAALETLTHRVYGAMASALQEPSDYRGIAALAPCHAGLAEVEVFLADIRLTADDAKQEAALSALLHQTDHLLRLLERLTQTGRIAVLKEDPLLRRPALIAGAVLRRLVEASPRATDRARLRRIETLVSQRKERHRRALLLGEHAGLYDLSEVFAHTDAMRWLSRSLHHLERLEHYRNATSVVLPVASKPS
ncbi:Na/Pi cotransporter family protein [Pseudophaeobacter sp. EL27]|uniref:Na/Pi cotransporter family protein n=1 Tax=Pseudophaeobacter sp. EL27 TaxID=2107580 RepID=UPI000EFCF563|nr:Na/Pi symporter [Pseudophaeobacter sp. EL27]